jgi:hypothetical protein
VTPVVYAALAPPVPSDAPAATAGVPAMA